MKKEEKSMANGECTILDGCGQGGDDDGDDELWTYRTFNRILLALGIRRPRSYKSGWRRWLARLTLLVPCFFILHGSLYSIAWIVKLKQRTKSRSLDMGSAMGVSLVVWMFGCVASVVCLLKWDGGDYTRRLATLIDRATNRAGAREWRRFMWFRVAVHIGAMAILATSSFAFQFTMVSMAARRRANDSTSEEDDFDGSILGHAYLDYASVPVVFYAAGCWSLATSYVTLGFAAIVDEFETFAKKLESHRDWTMRSLREFTTVYFRLAHAVEFMDSMFAAFLFFTLAGDIANFILHVYSLMTGENDQSILVKCFLGLTTFFLTLRFVAFSLSPAKLHELALKSATIITKSMDCDAIAKDPELYRTASWFVQQVILHPVGVTIGGFAVITKPLLLTVVSVVVTYLILLVQMAQENAVGRNETSSS